MYSWYAFMGTLKGRQRLREQGKHEGAAGGEGGRGGSEQALRAKGQISSGQDVGEGGRHRRLDGHRHADCAHIHGRGTYIHNYT